MNLNTISSLEQIGDIICVDNEGKVLDLSKIDKKDAIVSVDSVNGDFLVKIKGDDKSHKLFISFSLEVFQALRGEYE